MLARHHVPCVTNSQRMQQRLIGGAPNFASPYIAPRWDEGGRMYCTKEGNRALKAYYYYCTKSCWAYAPLPNIRILVMSTQCHNDSRIMTIVIKVCSISKPGTNRGRCQSATYAGLCSVHGHATYAGLVAAFHDFSHCWLTIFDLPSLERKTER